MPQPVRVSPFPPLGSPELLQIHAALQAALDRRDEHKLTRVQRVEMAQALRRAAVQVEP